MWCECVASVLARGVPADSAGRAERMRVRGNLDLQRDDSNGSAERRIRHLLERAGLTDAQHRHVGRILCDGRNDEHGFDAGDRWSPALHRATRPS